MENLSDSNIRETLRALPIVKRKRALRDLKESQFVYSKKRLGELAFQAAGLGGSCDEIVSIISTLQSVFSLHDLSDMPLHRHSLSIEGRQKFSGLIRALESKISEFKKQAGI
jgi:hypothetical protein